jgi:DNA repair protein RadC
MLSFEDPAAVAAFTPMPGEPVAVRYLELRERAAAYGLQTLGEAETLELYLCRITPADARALAEALLVRFGCLPRVLGATIGELGQVVDPAIAVDLKLLHETTRRVLAFPILKRSLLSSWSAVHAYLKLSLAGQAHESFRVLYLDRANQLIADALMGEGTVDHAPVYPREVMRRALELAASACCLVHNHPSGADQPFGADIEITRRVVEAGKALGVVIHDHFLVAGDAVVSFKALGLM